MVQQPFFTIGVPTFNRHDLLRETLNSILAQSFADFEVIVGNDYTNEMLTCKMLGINDPRVRIVNHPNNLREIGNMNALLAEASGRYFTWQFDDDLYEPNFLQTAHDALSDNNFPPAVFPSYRVLFDSEQLKFNDILCSTLRQLSGREYLAEYSAERLKLNSTTGFFDTIVLRKLIGGVEEICTNSVNGLYAEYLFLVKCALFGKIMYMDAPFVIFRVHAKSWGERDTDLDKYLEAGGKLLRRAAEVLRLPSFSDDLDGNLMALCKMHLLTFATKSAMFEVVRKKYGISAAWRALSRFMKEARKIQDIFYAEGGTDNKVVRRTFISIKWYCSRLILGKLRRHWFKRSC